MGELRENLKALAPDHEFLKEPLEAGAIPDQATVDRYGKEVTRIVAEKVDAKTEELRSKSTHDHRSGVRTISGGIDLRAEFDGLKVSGKRVYTQSGQYSEGRGGEMYELPGGIRIGFRMANDMNAGTAKSTPTLDIKLPGQRPIKFHYNEGR